METRAHPEEPVLHQLREEFTGHRIWRSRRPDGRPGFWVATLHDPDAGVDPTVISPDSGALRKALVEERERAVTQIRRGW